MCQVQKGGGVRALLCCVGKDGAALLFVTQQKQRNARRRLNYFVHHQRKQSTCRDSDSTVLTVRVYYGENRDWSTGGYWGGRLDAVRVMSAESQ